MIQKIFHLRVCDDTVFKNRQRPCILYQIKRCSGPCVGYVNEMNIKKQSKMPLNLSLVNQEKYKKVFQIKWKKLVMI